MYALQEKHLKDQRLVLVYTMVYVRALEGGAFILADDLAEELDVCTKTVRRKLEVLVDEGLLTCKEVAGVANFYEVPNPTTPAAPSRIKIYNRKGFEKDKSQPGHVPSNRGVYQEILESYLQDLPEGYVRHYRLGAKNKRQINARLSEGKEEWLDMFKVAMRLRDRFKGFDKWRGPTDIEWFLRDGNVHKFVQWVRNSEHRRPARGTTGATVLDRPDWQAAKIKELDYESNVPL